MRVDESRDHDRSRGIDHLIGVLPIEVGADRRDLPVHDQQIDTLEPSVARGSEQY